MNDQTDVNDKDRAEGQSRLNDGLDTDFRKGARAMFDALAMRAANHYHGNPKINALYNAENEVVMEWAIDALSEVSPDDCSTWHTITELQKELILLRANASFSREPERSGGESAGSDS